MTKERSELKWLSRVGGEWRWVQQYISRHADASMRAGTDRFARRKVEGYDQVVVDIADFELTTEGLKFVTRLKNALRQHRYRSASNGRKPCTFSLPNTTRASLSRRAKDNRVTETEAITRLIDDTEWAVRKHSEREKTLKTTLTLERMRSELTIEALKAQLEGTMKHLERSTELVVMWEQAMDSEQPPFNGDRVNVKREMEKRLKKVKAVNAIIALNHDLPSRD